MINQNFLKLSKRLRKDQTPWEKKIWMHLRRKRLSNSKWKRQVVIGEYIVDFCCYNKKLIIELDGAQHKNSENLENDIIRDLFLREEGYTILRFNNNDVDTNLDGILETIYHAVTASTSPPTPLLARRGG